MQPCVYYFTEPDALIAALGGEISYLFNTWKTPPPGDTDQWRIHGWHDLAYNRVQRRRIIQRAEFRTAGAIPCDIQRNMLLFCRRDVMETIQLVPESTAVLIEYALVKSFTLEIGWEKQTAASWRKGGVEIPEDLMGEPELWRPRLHLYRPVPEAPTDPNGKYNFHLPR